MKIDKLIIFVLGAAVGSAATWKYAKEKYEKISQEEIDSVKETFSYKTIAQTYDTADTAVVTEIKRPEKTAVKRDYTAASKITAESKPVVEECVEAETDEAYIISPEEFGEKEEYDKIGLNYFSDQVLTDDNDDPIEDIKGTVGFDSLSHFGEYEDDSVFVRNDRLGCDYEILLDRRKYTDVVKRKPHEVTD